MEVDLLKWEEHEIEQELEAGEDEGCVVIGFCSLLNNLGKFFRW